MKLSDLGYLCLNTNNPRSLLESSKWDTNS